LNNRLFEQLVVLWVGVIAVAHAYVVLGCYQWVAGTPEVTDTT
jgi:hypothetical protein